MERLTNRYATAIRARCRPPHKSKAILERKSKNRTEEQKPKRRVPVTALIAWPSFHLRWKQRSKIRWQHRLKREHPTGTERKYAQQECGWKGSDSGPLGRRKTLSNEKTKNT